MDFNIYNILIFVAGFSIGSIITSLIHLFFFKRNMKKVHNWKEQIKYKIIGKNF
jgi:uncharacterized membrane protein YciS (DUF1049 family)